MFCSSRFEVDKDNFLFQKTHFGNNLDSKCYTCLQPQSNLGSLYFISNHLQSAGNGGFF